MGWLAVIDWRESTTSAKLAGQSELPCGYFYHKSPH